MEQLLIVGPGALRERGQVQDLRRKAHGRIFPNRSEGQGGERGRGPSCAGREFFGDTGVMAWEAIEYFTYLAGLVRYSLLFYMVLVPTTLLLITWLCTSNAREI